ncbi:MAG: hypothetical protein AAF602_02130 [Myxococcota bacterium]
MIGVWLWLVAGASASEVPEPSEHTLVYYNARLALREGDPDTAARLWLLRNALETRTGRVSVHDDDFGSVTWAALGLMGICPDGQPLDEAGAGLWPLALHNWVIRNRNRRSFRKASNPFRAFDVGRQARQVSIEDVLSAEELRNVKLLRGRCLRPRLALLNAGEAVDAKLTDRPVAARLLRYLLFEAFYTLDREHVRGMSVIDARLFDLDLELTQLAARTARQEARKRSRRGRRIGLTRESVTAMREDAPKFEFDKATDAKLVLRQSRDWSTNEWMALSSERRRFLYDQARAYVADPEAFDAIALAILDALIEQGDGADVQRWIARYGGGDPALRETIWAEDRGQKLLSLGRESGFRERSVIALHRGVRFLEQGELAEALRGFAYAIDNASASRRAEEVRALSLRWMTYVASQFEITDDLLVTLQELVPRREYTVLLEDLLWSAAFRADRASFERGMRRQPPRAALERRTRVLEPLARGQSGVFLSRVRTGLAESPSEMLRLLGQLVQRLEIENQDVRAAQVPTLKRVRALVEPLADPDSPGSQRRRAQTLLEETLALIEGLGGLGADASGRDRARSLDPTGTVYAGSVRLAPSDPLPWPFVAGVVSPPSVFTPIQLTPEEWLDEDGTWVFGWSIGG